MTYKKPRKYKCYRCGVTDENWSCATWTRSEDPIHYTCGNYFRYDDRYKFGESFCKIVRHNREKK